MKTIKNATKDTMHTINAIRDNIATNDFATERGNDILLLDSSIDIIPDDALDIFDMLNAWVDKFTDEAQEACACLTDED